MNPYQILQLPESATYQQIKQRYRHLSKMIHPDKQPIQNYQIAKKHFKQIDQAYKSISSDLRRYIYKHYGNTGITILENNPFAFSQFQKADLSDTLVLNKLNTIMVYCMYEEHASNQIDKNVLKTKTILLVNKPINNINQLPSIQRTEYSFQTSLPDFWGMSHTLNITHASEGLNSQTKSGMLYGIGSSKRITQKFMLNAHTHISNQRVGMQLSIDRTLGNNLILHFVPINLQNGQLHRLQVGADFHRDGYYISGVTDFNDMTVQIGTAPPNKPTTYSIKFGLDDKSFTVSPVFQKQITARLRLFAQVNFRAQTGQANDTNNVSFGLAYGYKLKLLDELKLQLVSFIGVPHSNFQISILTPKFKANIPIYSRAQLQVFQLYKIGAFIGVLLSFQLYNYLIKKSERRRKRMEFQNYNRIAVEKIAVAKSNSDLRLIAQESKQNQIKYSGLVILVAYIGSVNAINYVQFKIKKQRGMKDKKLPELLQIAQKLLNQIPTSQSDQKNQLYQITQTIQAKVKGSQLFEYNVEELRVNPCLDQKQAFYSLTLYYMRGKVFLFKKHSSKPLKIGNLKPRYKPWSHSIFNFIKNYLTV